MRILFTTGNSFLPQSVGGAQSSTDGIARCLLAAGHRPAVLCRLDGRADEQLTVSRAIRKLTGRRFTRDRGLGYPVFRAWDLSEPEEVAGRFRPDVAIVQHGEAVPIATRLRACGVPIVFFFRNLEQGDLGGDPSSIPDARFIANSRFSARWHRKAFGVDAAVVPPLVEASRYRVESTREFVTFINPHPIKGVDVALAVARACPEIPFLFVESWRLPDEMRADLRARLAGLDNVTLRPASPDARDVYRVSRIVLAPSQWDEAWGRIASEAHVSGIPVVGSNAGGLPEAIGDGGVTLDRDAPVERWAEAIRRLWHDEAEYARLSEAARTYAGRQEVDPRWQMETFLRVAREAIGAVGRARPAGATAPARVAEVQEG